MLASSRTKQFSYMMNWHLLTYFHLPPGSPGPRQPITAFQAGPGSLAMATSIGWRLTGRDRIGRILWVTHPHTHTYIYTHVCVIIYVYECIFTPLPYALTEMHPNRDEQAEHSVLRCLASSNVFTTAEDSTRLIMWQANHSQGLN